MSNVGVWGLLGTIIVVRVGSEEEGSVLFWGGINKYVSGFVLLFTFSLMLNFKF